MNWKRWIRPGGLLTLLVAIVAVLFRDGGIERDLAERVTQALVADGYTWASTEVSSRDVTIRGQAPSIESQEVAVRVAGAVTGVRRAIDGSELLPIASPYVWIARREGASLVLTGNLPSEGSRGQVLAAARRALPDAEIRDEMGLARGAPVAFNSASAFAVAALADLADGAATLTDSSLAVTGTAATEASYAHFQTALTSELPASVSLSRVDVLPPRADPFVWSAEFDGEAVTMVGYVPNDIVHESLLATIRATLPGATIRDGTALASGEPAGFAEAAAFAIGALERLSRGGVTLDGLSLDVSGDARSVDDHETLLASLAGPFPAGMTVVAAAVMPAPASPYGWEARRSDESVVLSGYVPSAAMRDEVAAAARELFVGQPIDDRVRVAAGEPRMDWIGAIQFALRELALLKSGRVAVGDRTFSVSGEAISADAYISLGETNAKTLPASLEIETAEIMPPAASPYLFSAERQGRRVVLNGYAPDEATRAQIVAAVHRKFGPVDLVGDVTFASGAPAGYGDAVVAALQALSRTTGGSVGLSGTEISISGFATGDGKQEMLRSIEDSVLPEGYAIVSKSLNERQPFQNVAAQRCAELLQETFSTGTIEFEGTEPVIVADSYGFLDRVAGAMTRCPEVTIEVGGHTDSEGSASRNRDRTLARAQAVVDFLVDVGVKRERLEPIGYGEDNPIADNDTDGGRAANRRIEFSVELPSQG